MRSRPSNYILRGAAYETAYFRDDTDNKSSEGGQAASDVGIEGGDGRHASPDIQRGKRLRRPDGRGEQHGEQRHDLEMFDCVTASKRGVSRERQSGCRGACGSRDKVLCAAAAHDGTASAPRLVDKAGVYTEF